MTVPEALLSTVHYSDIFDFPLTAEELYQRLLYLKIPKTEFDHHLKDFSGIEERDGYYFLPGRSALVPVRAQREKLSAQKIRKVRFGLTLLRLVPWIKLVGVTGSVGAKNAVQNDDVDLLVVASSGRVWLSRLFATLLLDLFRVRRRKKDRDVANKICLNMFLSENSLKLEEDVYTAYELIQLKPIWWKENTYYKLLSENKWLSKLTPNYVLPEPRRLVIPAGLFPLPFLNIVDRWVYTLQKKAMAIRGNETVRRSDIRFHPLNTKLWILNEFYLRTNIKLG